MCWSGYYHGILERAFAGVSEEELPAVSRRLCSSDQVRTSDFVAYQCVHGLGHGLMIYTSYDMPLSLETCDALSTGWDQTSCTGGVFMENLQTSYGTRSKWLRDDDPLYPCPTVAERHKLYCYLMVTSRILDVVGGDWQQTVDWCRKAEEGWVETCFQSLGRDASGRSLQDPPEIIRICSLAGDMTDECLFGAARDITSMDAGARAFGRLLRRDEGSLSRRLLQRDRHDPRRLLPRDRRAARHLPELGAAAVLGRVLRRRGRLGKKPLDSGHEVEPFVDPRRVLPFPAARRRPGAVPGDERVGAVAALDHVPAGPAGQLVAAAASAQDIVPTLADEEVEERRPRAPCHFASCRRSGTVRDARLAACLKSITYKPQRRHSRPEA